MGMSQEQSRPRRAPSESRQSSGATNVNSTLSIIIAVLAVLLGFFILRDIRSDQTGQSSVAATEIVTDSTETTMGEVVVPTTLVL